uniref:Uncharacterized protein n=1 Tax=Abalone asfa-like virus TaxID=2839893 RepID=A0A5K7XX76_9VIRU|nr:hypothetical protein [Abalone asfa-like virus]
MPSVVNTKQLKGAINLKWALIKVQNNNFIDPIVSIKKYTFGGQKPVPYHVTNYNDSYGIIHFDHPVTALELYFTLSDDIKIVKTNNRNYELISCKN